MEGLGGFGMRLFSPLREFAAMPKGLIAGHGMIVFVRRS
jgi:hypothetical protein